MSEQLKADLTAIIIVIMLIMTATLIAAFVQGGGR